MQSRAVSSLQLRLVEGRVVAVDPPLCAQRHHLPAKSPCKTDLAPCGVAFGLLHALDVMSSSRGSPVAAKRVVSAWGMEGRMRKKESKTWIDCASIGVRSSRGLLATARFMRVCGSGN